jgi:hypothetical protein
LVQQINDILFKESAELDMERERELSDDIIVVRLSGRRRHCRGGRSHTVAEEGHWHRRGVAGGLAHDDVVEAHRRMGAWWPALVMRADKGRQRFMLSIGVVGAGCLTARRVRGRACSRGQLAEESGRPPDLAGEVERAARGGPNPDSGGEEAACGRPN